MRQSLARAGLVPTILRIIDGRCWGGVHVPVGISGQRDDIGFTRIRKPTRPLIHKSCPRTAAGDYQLVLANNSSFRFRTFDSSSSQLMASVRS